MPCWQVRLTTVDFNMKSVDLLEKAAKSLGYKVNIEREGKQVVVYDYSTMIRLDLENQKATFDLTNMNKFNHLKKTYSIKVAEDMAKKHKWLFKQNQNKIFLKRF